MKSIYKLARVACASFICFFMPISAALSAANTYTVNNVEVDIVAENALTARDEAFETAQRLAFERLAERFLTEEEQAEMELPDPITLASMIRDYEVTREKISNVRYIGNYTFRFKQDHIRNFFAGSAVTYSDEQSDPILILPFFQTNNRLDLWSFSNIWKTAWDRVDGDDSLIPIAVPIGDIQDVSDVKDNEATNYDPQRLDQMAMRYGASEILIAIAMPDEEFIGASSNDNDFAKGTLSINLLRAGDSGPEAVGQLDIAAREGQTRADMLGTAVRSVQNWLRKDWKKKTTLDPGEIKTLTAAVPVYSLTQWARIQRGLAIIKNIQDTKVESINPKQVVVTLTYHGSEASLMRAIQKQRMVLEKKDMLTMANQPEGAPPYKLSLIVYRPEPQTEATPEAEPTPPQEQVEEPQRSRLDSLLSEPFTP